MNRLIQPHFVLSASLLLAFLTITMIMPATAWAEPEPEDDSLEGLVHRVIDELAPDASASDREAFLDFLREEVPVTFELLEALPTSDKHRRFEVVEHMGHMFHEYRELRETAPEDAARLVDIHRREAKSRLLALEIRRLKERQRRNPEAVNEEDLDEMRENLREQLEDLFGLKLEQESRELELMDQELEELRELHEQRAENRDVIVEQYYLELVGEGDAMSW